MDDFSRWAQAVDGQLFDLAGVVSADLSDHPWRDWWEYDDLSPQAAALAALELEGCEVL